MKTERLKRFALCSEAKEWMKSQKNATEAWNNCERGDWMLWIAKKLNVDDRKLTMAKAMCAKQVEYLMKDQRSKDALQACIDYFNGLISREQLNAAAATAYATAASYAAAAATAYAATAASYATAYATAAAATAYATAASYAADAAAAYADDANAYATRTNSLKQSADICREYLTEEVMAKYRRLR